MSGTTGLREDHLPEVEARLESLDNPTEITTGGAEGVDTFCMVRLLNLFPSKKRGGKVHHRLVVPAAPHDHSWERIQQFMDEIIHMPNGRHPYRERNHLLVYHGDVLEAFPLKPENQSPRSGTWMTIRLGRKKPMDQVNVTILE
jgi:hypothetical protein